MVDPGTRRPRERWLRVVRDGEEAPEPPPEQAAAATDPPPSPPPSSPPSSPAAPGAGRRPAGVGGVLVVAAAGTAGALGADHLVGGLDGHPALHLLILLALPFWDGLPARLGPRLLALAAGVAAVAAVWLLLADLRPEPWWRAEAAFGLACAGVGLGQLALSARARRTVDR